MRIPMILAGCVVGLRASAAHAGETRYHLTDANTKIEFTGTTPGGKHDGGFKRVTGKVVLAGGAAPRVDLEIDCGSLYSDNFMLTWHLKGGDFFNVKKPPETRFTSTSIDRTERGYRITGNLTFLDVTKPVRFPAVITTGDALRLNGAVAINRQDCGMTYGKGKNDDLVELRFNVDTSR